jgi:hypothetical protein
VQSNCSAARNEVARVYVFVGLEIWLHTNSAVVRGYKKNSIGRGKLSSLISSEVSI